MNATGESPEQVGARIIHDLKDVLDAKFRAGEGVVVIAPTVSDSELVSVMRVALSHGAPFKVVPGEKLTHFITDEWPTRPLPTDHRE